MQSRISEQVVLRVPFIHPHSLQAEEAKSTLKILLRDFETDGLEGKPKS
jgi:hypothetical protein